jgi:hypothetical protein
VRVSGGAPRRRLERRHAEGVQVLAVRSLHPFRACLFHGGGGRRVGAYHYQEDEEEREEKRRCQLCALVRCDCEGFAASCMDWR